ncbi:hypothetical protein COCVIDRAFT_89917, partial [Bipolaris victoriae FI3]
RERRKKICAKDRQERQHYQTKQREFRPRKRVGKWGNKWGERSNAVEGLALRSKKKVWEGQRRAIQEVEGMR